MARVAHQIRIGEIGHVLTGELTGVVTRAHGGTVDDLTASKVQQVRRACTSSKPDVDQVVRDTLNVRDVDRDVVRDFEKLVQIIRARHLVPPANATRLRQRAPDRNRRRSYRDRARR